MYQADELRETVEVSLSLLEEHCQDLESVKQNTTSIAEDLLPDLEKRLAHIQPFYRMIDHLELVVRQIQKTVDSMDQELTVAENLFPSSPSFNVAKVFTTFLNSRKKAVTANRIHYEAPDIFKTPLLFDGIQDEDKCEEGAEAHEDESPPAVFNTPRSGD